MNEHVSVSLRAGFSWGKSVLSGSQLFVDRKDIAVGEIRSLKTALNIFEKEFLMQKKKTFTDCNSENMKYFVVLIWRQNDSPV